MARLIPGGRGPKLDLLVNNELLAQRGLEAQRVLPPYTVGMYPAVMEATGVGIYATTGVTLGPMEQIPVKTRLSEVRIVVNAASAGSVCDVGIYVYADRKFTLRSYGTVNTASVGVASTTLDRPITIDPQQRLFIGLKPRVADATLSVVPGSTHTAAMRYISAAATDTLAPSYSIDSLTKDSSIGLPAIHYFSTEGAALL